MTSEYEDLNNIHWSVSSIYHEEQEQETATVKRPAKLAIVNQKGIDENDDYEKMNLNGNQNDKNDFYENFDQNQTLELPRIIPSMKKT